MSLEISPPFCTVAGAAATKAETDKAKKYTGTYSLVTSTLITAAFETFGRIGTKSTVSVDTICNTLGSSISWRSAYSTDGAQDDTLERDLVSSTAESLVQKRVEICTGDACEICA
jgi:hypothetical protein